MELVNVELLRRPTNWIVVFTMVVFALFALHFSLLLIHGQGALTGASMKHPSRFA